MTATFPHSACAISYAVSGRSAISPPIFARAPLVQGEALVDQLGVLGDRLAVAGEHDLDRHLARLAQRPQVHHQRARAAVARLAGAPAERPREQRVGRDVADQVVAADQHAGARRPRTACPTGECPGRCSACSVRPANSSSSPSASRRSTGAPPPQARNDARDRRAARSPRRAGCRGGASAPRRARRRARRRRRTPPAAARAGRARPPRRRSGGRGCRAGPCGRCAGG